MLLAELVSTWTWEEASGTISGGRQATPSESTVFHKNKVGSLVLSFSPPQMLGLLSHDHTSHTRGDGREPDSEIARQQSLAGLSPSGPEAWLCPRTPGGFPHDPLALRLGCGTDGHLPLNGWWSPGVSATGNSLSREGTQHPRFRAACPGRRGFGGTRGDATFPPATDVRAPQACVRTCFPASGPESRAELAHRSSAGQTAHAGEQKRACLVSSGSELGRGSEAVGRCDVTGDAPRDRCQGTAGYALSPSAPLGLLVRELGPRGLFSDQQYDASPHAAPPGKWAHLALPEVLSVCYLGLRTESPLTEHRAL